MEGEVRDEAPACGATGLAVERRTAAPLPHRATGSPKAAELSAKLRSVGGGFA